MKNKLTLKGIRELFKETSFVFRSINNKKNGAHYRLEYKRSRPQIYKDGSSWNGFEYWGEYRYIGQFLDSSKFKHALEYLESDGLDISNVRNLIV